MNKSLFTPHNIVIFWWLTWGFVSLISLTDLFVPSGQTYSVLALFIFSLLIGGKFVKSDQFLEIKNSLIFENKIRKIFQNFFIFNSLVLLLVLSIIVVKSYVLMKQSIDPTIYRAIAFSTPEKVGLLFNSRVLENLYFFLSSPMLFYLAIAGLVDFWESTQIKKLSIAVLLNGMDAYFRLGRVNIYMMIVLIGIIFLCSDNKISSFLKHKKKEIALLLIAMGVILYVGTLRGYSAIQQLKLFVIDYHTVGFSLFDHEILNPLSELNQKTTYGRLTFGGLETVFTIFIRQFDKSYYSPALLNSITMSKNLLVGLENPPTFIFNGIKYYNSFYTLLYTFYSDGGFFGVFLGGFSLGFSLKYFQNEWRLKRKMIDGHILVLLISIGILSIFVSQLEIMRTWMLLLFFLAFKYSNEFKLKNEK